MTQIISIALPDKLFKDFEEKRMMKGKRNRSKYIQLLIEKDLKKW